MTSEDAPKHPERHGIWFNLGGILVAVALLGIGLAYGLDNARRQHRAAATEVGTITRTLAGHEYAIPITWFRFDEQKSEGFAEQIDLRFVLPLGAEGTMRAIDVQLIPRSRARPSASLLDGVYLHQFLPRQLQGPPGLVGKPLTPKEGFEDETVWYDALSANPFVAKCMAPIAGEGQARCLRTVLFSDIAAVYAFDADVLDNWRSFDPYMLELLSRIGIKPAS
jgi:hypothetical protein